MLYPIFQPYSNTFEWYTYMLISEKYMDFEFYTKSTKGWSSFFLRECQVVNYLITWINRIASTCNITQSCLLRNRFTFWDKYKLDIRSSEYLSYQRLLLEVNCRCTVQTYLIFHMTEEEHRQHHEHPLHSWVYFLQSHVLLQKKAISIFTGT
jgi:hypothetical protein